MLNRLKKVSFCTVIEKKVCESLNLDSVWHLTFSKFLSEPETISSFDYLLTVLQNTFVVCPNDIPS